MKKTQRYLGVYYVIMLLFMTAAVVLRTIACLTELDFKTGYFDGDICITLANSFAISGVIICFSYIFMVDKDMKLVASFDNPMTYVPGGAVSVSMLFLAVEMMRTVASNKEAFLSVFTLSNKAAPMMANARITNILTLIIPILAILGMMNFLFNALSEKRTDITRASFGIIMSVFLTTYAAYLYFSTELPLNAPNKIIDMMTYLFIAIFFLYETRLSLGRDMWRPYIAFGFISALLSGYSSLTALIVYFANGNNISDSITENVLTLTLFFFITARLVLTSKISDDGKSDMATAISKMSEYRLKEMVGETEEELAYARAEDNNEENGAESTVEDINYTITLIEDQFEAPQITESAEDTTKGETNE